jgi:hypothetical protein
VSWLDRFVADEYALSPESKGLYRMMFALFVLFTRMPDFFWIATFPDSFFRPPIGITMFFATGFPPTFVWYALNALIIGAAVFLFFGRFPNAATAVVVGGLLFGNAWAYSFGKINHDILLLSAGALGCLAGWGEAFSASPRTTKAFRERNWPIALLALVVSLGMFSTAAQKAGSGWLRPDTQATLYHLLINTFSVGRTGWPVQLALAVKSKLFWESLDLATVLLEGSFIFVVWRRSLFLKVCALACLFHFSIAVLMRIAFIENLVAYAAFVQWSSVLERVPGSNALLSAIAWCTRRTTPQIASIALAWAMAYLLSGNPIFAVARYLGDPVYVIGLLLCGLAAVLATLYLWDGIPQWKATR